MEIERLCLGNSQGTLRQVVAVRAFANVEAVELAVNLICGRVNDGTADPRFSGRFEDVEASPGIDLEVFARISHGRGYGNLRRQVEDQIGIGVMRENMFQLIRVANVGLLEFETPLRTKPLQVPLRALAGKVVDQNNVISLAQVAAGRITPDKPGSSGDNNFPGHALRFVLKTMVR